jgi:hypothetical protein
LADLDPVTIVFIYIAYFAFLLFLLGFGEVQGGEWQTVAQGVAKFSLLIVGFASAVWVIVGLLGRR